MTRFWVGNLAQWYFVLVFLGVSGSLMLGGENPSLHLVALVMCVLAMGLEFETRRLKAVITWYERGYHQLKEWQSEDARTPT